MNIGEAVRLAISKLNDSGVAEASREAASIVEFALSRDRTFLIAHPEYNLSADELTIFESALSRRSNREPLQYITEHREFFGLDFNVSPAVLIPRPETEILVERALEILAEIENPKFIELGIGSGCISISVLHSAPTASSFAVDISCSAIEIASANAVKHGVESRLEIIESDLFDRVEPQKFDLVVSNPPYIPDRDICSLQPEVRVYEPLSALAGGPDGLDIVRRIVKESPDFLKPGGYLLIEIGYGQYRDVADIFEAEIWPEVGFLYDLQQIPRIVVAKLASPVA